MRGDGRNSRSLQQERKEKKKPNQHGLPPTIAYGARIIGAKQKSRNTKRLTRRGSAECSQRRPARCSRLTPSSPASTIHRAFFNISSCRRVTLNADENICRSTPANGVKWQRPSVAAAQQRKILQNSDANLVDKLIAVHARLVMRQGRQKIRRFARPVLAAVVACLLFQQALALVYSHVHRGDDVGAFLTSPVAISGELCADQNDSDGRTRHVQHMHCMACFLSDRNDDIGSKVLLSVVVLVLAPLSETPRLWPEQRDLAPPTTQWPRNRLSRAPPSLLS